MITYRHIEEACRLALEALAAGGHQAAFDAERLTLAIDGAVYVIHVREGKAWGAGRDHRHDRVIAVGLDYDDAPLNALTMLHEVSHHLNGDVASGGKPGGPDASGQLLRLEIAAWRRAFGLFTGAHGAVPGPALEGAAAALASYLADLEAKDVALALLSTMGRAAPAAEQEPEPLSDTPF